METLTKSTTKDSFIQANTKETKLDFLKQETIIPAFAKDNESTISHVEFIESIREATELIFRGEQILDPVIRVSHPIKGRIPEAKGKPAKDLMEHEKTLYYERMTFLIEIESIQKTINGENLSLSVGGVRAYNQENLYNRKSPERFKVFIGFKNWVCTNLCISTDGYRDDLKVQSFRELTEQSLGLFQSFDQERYILQLQQLQQLQLGHHEFSHIIGRAKQYINLPSDLKEGKPYFPLGDSQLSQMIRGYYSLITDENQTISLWDFYNLMTAANKSSYIDVNLDRNVKCFEFSHMLGKAFSDQTKNWFTHRLLNN